MEFDWDEDPYEDVGRGGDDDEGDFGSEFGGDNEVDFGGDNEVGGDDFGEREELDFAADFRLQTNRPLADPISKRFRSPKEAALDQVGGILNVDDLTEAKKRQITRLVEDVPNIQNYNLGMLIVAAQYILDNGDEEMTRSNLDKFFKGINKNQRGLYLPRDINDLKKEDIIRYVTFMRGS